MDFTLTHILLLSFLSHVLSSDVSIEQNILNVLGIHMGHALNNGNSATRSKRADKFCTLPAILNRTNSCPAHSQLFELVRAAGRTGAEKVDLNALAATFCKDAECTIRCFTEAIGNCHQADEFFFVSDPVTRKVAHRAMCTRKHNFAEFVKNCGKLFPKKCIRHLLVAMLDVGDNFAIDKNSTKYRIDGCRAYSDYKKCFKVPITNECIAADAGFLEDMALASSSFVKCGDQSHNFFSKYGADAQCGDGQYQRYLTGTSAVAYETQTQRNTAASHGAALTWISFVALCRYLLKM